MSTRNLEQYERLNDELQHYQRAAYVNARRPYNDPHDHHKQKIKPFFETGEADLVVLFGRGHAADYEDAVNAIQRANDVADDILSSLHNSAVDFTLAFFDEYFPDHQAVGYMTGISQDFNDQEIQFCGIRLGSLIYDEKTDQIKGRLRFSGVTSTPDLSPQDMIANLTIKTNGKWYLSRMETYQREFDNDQVLPIDHPLAKVACEVPYQEFKIAERWSRLRRQVEPIRHQSMRVTMPRHEPLRVLSSGTSESVYPNRESSFSMRDIRAMIEKNIERIPEKQRPDKPLTKIIFNADLKAHGSQKTPLYGSTTHASLTQTCRETNGFVCMTSDKLADKHRVTPKYYDVEPFIWVDTVKTTGSEFTFEVNKRRTGPPVTMDWSGSIIPPESNLVDKVRDYVDDQLKQGPVGLLFDKKERPDGK